jgi:hypothetical protein
VFPFWATHGPAPSRDLDAGPGAFTVTTDHLDRDGIPPPDGPLGQPVGEVVTLRPTARGFRRPALPAAEPSVPTVSSRPGSPPPANLAGSSKASGQPTRTESWPPRNGRQDLGALDLAVSVACGRPWLDHFACPSPGPRPVLPRRMRGAGRIEAVADSKGVHPEQLADRLRLCFRVPRLAAPGAGAGSELAAIQAELEAHSAALVVLDPLYLAAAGAADRTCTTWALSSKPSRVLASTPAAPCWW